jgi:hypothetical protein
MAGIIIILTLQSTAKGGAKTLTLIFKQAMVNTRSFYSHFIASVHSHACGVGFDYSADAPETYKFFQHHFALALAFPLHQMSGKSSRCSMHPLPCACPPIRPWIYGVLPVDMGASVVLFYLI